MNAILVALVRVIRPAIESGQVRLLRDEQPDGSFRYLLEMQTPGGPLDSKTYGAFGEVGIVATEQPSDRAVEVSITEFFSALNRDFGVNVDFDKDDPTTDRGTQ